MPDILHKVGIKSSVENTYKALAAVDDLSGWWTSDTRGESKVGGVLRFRFGEGGFDMKVLELQSNERVLWQVVDGPEEWVGTKISFDLKQNGNWTSCSSSIRDGRSRLSSCIIAAPNGRFSY
jgi:hypothetical protein